MNISKIVEGIEREYNSLWTLVFGEVERKSPDNRDLEGLNKSLRYHVVREKILEEDKWYYHEKPLEIAELPSASKYRKAFAWHGDKILACEETRRARKAAKSGIFVHVFNNKVQNWEEYLQSFLNIDGEICASNLGDCLHSYRINTIGILLEGRPTASFDFDCWSLVKSDGFRKATKGYNDYSNRAEHWVVPATCKVRAIVMKKYDKAVGEAARNLNIPIQYL